MKKIIFFSIISLMCARVQGQWQLTGNAGTNSSTNFIGTTDNINFKIRTKNLVRITITAGGKVGIGTTAPVFKLDVKSGSINTDSVYRIKGNTVLSVKGDYNIFTGVNSGFSNTLGGANVGSGYQALYSNTEGNFNTASGYNAMQFNTKGYNNTAIGAHALINNRTASENIAIGNSALFVQSYNNGGVDWVSANVAVGSFALFSNQPTSTSAGVNNTAVGHSALRSNTTGYSNTAGGFQALQFNTTGFGNTAFGVVALQSNTLGNSNAALGAGALRFNTTGSHNIAIGDNALWSQSFNNSNTSWLSTNIAIGSDALFSNQPSSVSNGVNNTAIGFYALRSNTIGKNNLAVGNHALFTNTTGSSNTAIGSSALYTSSGNYNTAIGFEALKLTTIAIDNCAVGGGAGSSFANGNWCTFVGVFADANAAGYFNSTVIGEGADMTASHQVRSGDAAVTSIGGYAGWTTLPSDRRFKKNIRENVPGLDFINRLLPVTYTVDVKGINSFLRPYDKTADKPGTADKEKIIYTGFIAQDVEKAAKEINYDFSGIDAPKNDKDIYGLRYAEFVVPLVKAVQELSQELDLIKDLLTEEQKQKLNEIKIETIGALEQNSPNPFNTQTEIKFQLPEKFNSAQLIITDVNGKQVRNEVLKSSSPVIIEASELSAGTYYYSLIIDGLNIETKQMILTK